MKGIRGSLPARLSQPVDPSGVGGLLCFLQIMIGAELLVSFSKTFLSRFNWFLLYYYSFGTDLIAPMFNRQICWRILRHWTFGTLYTHMFFMLDCFPMSLFEQVFIDNPLVLLHNYSFDAELVSLFSCFIFFISYCACKV